MLMTADKRDAAEYANRKLFCEKRERIQVPRNFIDSGGGEGLGFGFPRKWGKAGWLKPSSPPPPPSPDAGPGGLRCAKVTMNKTSLQNGPQKTAGNMC